MNELKKRLQQLQHSTNDDFGKKIFKWGINN